MEHTGDILLRVGTHTGKGVSSCSVGDRRPWTLADTLLEVWLAEMELVKLVLVHGLSELEL